MPLPRSFNFIMPFVRPNRDQDHEQNARVMERAMNGLPIFDKEVHYDFATDIWSNATTSYTEFGGTTSSVGNVSGLFYKYDSNTKLIVTVSGTFYTSQLGLAVLGVTFVDQLSSATTTYDVTKHFFNAAVLGTHMPFVGTTKITDLPAGQYYVTMVAKAAAAQTIQTDANDHGELIIEERPIYA
jgi:hypothetical protein